MDSEQFRRVASVAAERAISALSVVAGIVFLLVAGRAFLGADRSSQGITLRPGSIVPLTGVPWDKHIQTLIISLQADCELCDASVNFYQDLLTSNVHKAFHPIVVMPHTETIGRRLLDGHGLKISDVRKADLAAFGMPGTPALLLVGPDGRLAKAWLGKLDGGSEDAVFKALGLKRLVRTSAVIRTQGYESLTAGAFATQNPLPVILDTRPREEFKQGHLAAAINIPLDELAVRIPHEWPQQTKTVLYCERPPTCNLLLASNGFSRGECEIATDSLRRSGLAQVRILDGTLDEFEAVGVPVNWPRR